MKLMENNFEYKFKHVETYLLIETFNHPQLTVNCYDQTLHYYCYSHQNLILLLIVFHFNLSFCCGYLDFQVMDYGRVVLQFKFSRRLELYRSLHFIGEVWYHIGDLRTLWTTCMLFLSSFLALIHCFSFQSIPLRAYFFLEYSSLSFVPCPHVEFIILFAITSSQQYLLPQIQLIHHSIFPFYLCLIWDKCRGICKTFINLMNSFLYPPLWNCFRYFPREDSSNIHCLHSWVDN